MQDAPLDHRAGNALDRTGDRLPVSPSDTDQAGDYRPTVPLVVKADLGALLVEVLLRGRSDGGLTSEQIYRHPALFLFELDVRPYELRRRQELEVFRQGVDMEFIRLKQ